MKLKPILFVLYLFSILILSSFTCGYDYYYENRPIYLSLDKIKNDFKLLKPQKLTKLGKIYLYKNYIFINENNIGIHVIDNANNKNPKNIGFIKIFLNEDISIKDDIIYADSLGDLVSIDISDLNNIKELKRINTVKNKENFYISNFLIDKDSGLQIGYRRVGPIYRTKDCVNFGCTKMPQTIVNKTTDSINKTNTSTGQGGSLARFSIVGDYLYTVTSSDINLFNIKDPKNPISLGKVKIEQNTNDVETIYAYKDKLFLGSTTGAYIYDNTNPEQPTFITKVEHTRSCDPVVVENDRAYVTLRNGNRCRGVTNQLDIIDIEDIKKSKIIKTYPMTNPAGLAIKDNNLFICDGSSGLKIFDAKESLNLKEIAKVSINNPLDIILNNDYQGIVVSEEGLHQYDFSGLPNKTEFQELSTIKTESSDIFNPDNVVKEADNIYYYKWYKEYFQN